MPTLRVGRMADCEARAWGGYERAERVRLVLGRTEVLDGEEEGFAAKIDESTGIVTLLDVQGNFLFDKADHRDFLGSTLGAGRVKRPPLLASAEARPAP